MEAVKTNELTVTRRVVINKVFDGSQWDKIQKAWIKKDGFKQVFFGSMIGVFKHQITDKLYNEANIIVGKEYDVTYSLREYTDSKYDDYRCSISTITDLKPIS